MACPSGSEEPALEKLTVSGGAQTSGDAGHRDRGLVAGEARSGGSC